jgi:hypothetical protein
MPSGVGIYPSTGGGFPRKLSPVINDVTFCILLIMMMTWNLKGKSFNIKPAFSRKPQRNNLDGDTQRNGDK